MIRDTIPALLLAGLLASVPPAQAAEKDLESFDVLFLTADRPVATRFELAVNGKPLGESWEKFADALFDHMDTNKNGTLETEESIRLPQTLALLTMRASSPTPRTAPAMSRNAFREYLRKNDLGPLRLPQVADSRSSPRRIAQTSTRGQSDAIDKALMELLDSNKDGRLSKAELAAAPAILSKIDADENELISMEEILGREIMPPEQTDEDAQPIDRKGMLEILRLDRKADPVLAKRLLDRYRPKQKSGMPPARWLSKSDLKIPDQLFASIDQDGNEELDVEELSRFGGLCKPEIAFAFQLGKVPDGKKAAVVNAAGKAPVVATASNPGASVVLTLPGTQLDIAPANWEETNEWRRSYLSLFHSLDRDENGYVDETEARNSGLFRLHFEQFDTDGNRKIFQNELEAVLKKLEPLASHLAESVVTVEVLEAGFGLFGLFDANGDGQLSIRELRQLVKLLERDGRTHDTLAPTDVVRRFQVTFVSGLNSTRRVRRIEDSPMEQRALGPLWFQKMDRNRDGDVSRREFLGTEEEFLRFDLNKDGLIDWREAEAANNGATR